MPKNIKACLSHNHDNWKTPKKIYDYFINELNCIDTFEYMSEGNELENDYQAKRLFINPPFSKLDEITEWIIKQINNGNEIYLLIPARTDTKYFHKLLKYKPTIYFIKGRLHYNDSNSAPFPTILMFLCKNKKEQAYRAIEQNDISC